MHRDEPRPLVTMAVCTAAQAIGGGLAWSVVPALLPMMAKDLGLSRASGALAWGAAALGIALASPFGGAAVDRFGVRWTAGAAMLAGAAACAARAITHDAWSLGVAMLAFGAHIGFVAPAIPRALAGHVPAGRVARANGLALLGYTFGTAATVLVARTVLAPALGGWRPTMLAAAAAMVVMSAFWSALVRDRGVRASHADVRAVLALSADASMRRVAAIHFCLFGGYLALLGLLPRALSDAGRAPADVGAAIATWLAIAGIANAAGPWLSDRLGRRRPVIIVGALVAGIALCALAIAPRAAAAPLLFVAALGGGSFAPILLVLPLELPGIGTAKAGSALGLLMLVGQAGGFALSTLAGIVADAAGFSAAIAVIALGHLAIVWPAARLSETGPRASRRASYGPVPVASKTDAAAGLTGLSA